MRKDEIDQLREYLRNLPRLSDTGKKDRVAKAKKDFWYFIRTYFSHHVEAAEEESSAFRAYVHANIANLEKKHSKMAFYAYRGSAKTTTLSRLYVLWRMARGTTRFTVLISDTIDVATSNLEFIKIEIEENQNYRHDFSISDGEMWQNEEVLIKSPAGLIKIKCYGSAKRIRGANFLGFRPDLLILDDIENDENVESKTQRDKLYTWFNKAILKLPNRNKPYTIIVVGTILHHDSVLSRIAKRKDFFVKSFPLVLSFPKNMEGWEALYLLGIEAARKRYDARRAYYDAGFIVDDDQVNKFDVMFEYFEDKDAFLSELQNNPISKDRLVFQNYTTFEQMPLCDAYYIGVDPALGKSKKGDYYALAYLGYVKKEGKIYASAQGYKITAYKMIEKLIALYVRLAKTERPVKIAIETVAFQDFYKDIVKLLAKERAGIHLPVVEIKNHAAKELRIEGLAPLSNDGTIIYDANSHLLREELDTYPKSPHDDLIDAVEMAYRCHSKKTLSDYKLIQREIKAAKFQFLKQKETYV